MQAIPMALFTVFTADRWEITPKIRVSSGIFRQAVVGFALKCLRVGNDIVKAILGCFVSNGMYP